MKFFHIILKIIEVMNLTSSDDHARLTNDVKDWEADCVPESDDKLKSIYAKAHKGVWLRLINPFIYFYLLGWVRNLMNPREDNFLED